MITKDNLFNCHDIEILKEALVTAVKDLEFEFASLIKKRMIEITYVNEWVDGNISPFNNDFYFCLVKKYDDSIKDYVIKKVVLEYFHMWICEEEYEIVKWLYYNGDLK